MDERSLKHFYDALIAARAIKDFIKGKTFDDYISDDLLSSGVERKFEIIGEALNRIRRDSPEDLDRISECRDIIDFRNVLAHAYDHVDDSLVWGIAVGQLSKFIAELEMINNIEG